MLSRRSPFANLRGLISAFGCAAALGLAAPTLAQTPIPPPVFPAVDGNGVDVSTGAFTYSRTDLVIGQPGAGGLAYTRYYQSAPSAFWTHNHIGYVAGTGTTCSVVVGVFTETFTSSLNDCGGTFTSDQQHGGTLSGSQGAGYTYTARDGTVATFRGRDVAAIYGMPSTMTGYLWSVTTPSGEATSSRTTSRRLAPKIRRAARQSGGCRSYSTISATAWCGSTPAAPRPAAHRARSSA